MTTHTLRPALAGTAALCLLAACAVVATGLPTSAAADDANTRTYTLSGKKVSSKYLDTGRKGPSTGDRHLTALTLKQDGGTAGRLLIECVAVDKVYEGQTCDLAAQLADGTLFFSGVGFHEEIPGVGSGDDSTYAITGGTGAFLGAAGDATVGPDEDGPLTITLLP